MMEIDRPEVLAEVTAAFERYEQALADNDIDVLNELFWDDLRVVRLGVGVSLHGPDAIRQFRSSRPTDDLDRTLLSTAIMTFGDDAATTVVEFRRHKSGRHGHQSQTWIRTGEGWRIVLAHVSLHDDACTTAVPRAATGARAA